MTVLNSFPRSTIMKSVQAQKSADLNFSANAVTPRLVIAGETNSGKTSLVNFLLRSNLLQTDIVANTRCPTFLRYGRTERVRIQKSDGTEETVSLAEIRGLNLDDVEFIEIAVPNPVLRRMQILDLPGFVSRRDAEDKKRWFNSSDMLIWCSPATQSWKASEQSVWQALNHPRHASLLALTHRDLLSEEQFNHVTERISAEAQRYFRSWSAIATTRAIAARNMSEQATKREMRYSTGIDDFMKKLINMLQGAVSPREATDQAPIIPTTQINANGVNSLGMTHPLHALAELRQEAGEELQDCPTPQQSALLLSSKLKAYNEAFLRPWMLSKGRTLSQSKQIESLINIDEEEFERYLAPQSEKGIIFTPLQVLDQLAGELGEILTSIEVKRS